jgi:hypothetical protein
VNDGPVPFDAPDMSDTSDTAPSPGGLDDVDGAGASVGPLIDAGEPPAHLFAAALERAFASSPDEADTSLLPEDEPASSFEAGADQLLAAGDLDEEPAEADPAEGAFTDAALHASPDHEGGGADEAVGGDGAHELDDGAGDGDDTW